MVKTERYSFILISSLIFVYLGFRSYYIPLIHDEAITYYLYFQTGNFLYPWAFLDANNHLLNSAIGALFNLFFGHSPFMSRLGSWLSFLPFAYFLFHIGQFYKDRFARWFFYIPLLTTPFFIEFFSLSRGYGMAMAWFMGTMYFTLRYINSKSQKDLILISVTGVLASLSSLSLIVALFIIYGWILLSWIIQSKEKIIPALLKWLKFLMLPQLPMVLYVLVLKENGLLYYGGDSVVSFTLKPFAYYFFHHKELWWIAAVGVTILMLGNLIHTSMKGFDNYFKPSNLFSFVLFLSVISIFAQHFLLGVNYPEDRAALYFFPLIIGSWVTFPLSSIKYFKYAWLGLLLWFPIDLATSANIQYSRLWPHEHIPYRFWEKVNEIKPNGYPASFSAYSLRKWIWDYQSLDKNYTSSPNSEDYPSKWADVIMVDTVKVSKVSLSKYDILDYDEFSGQTLLVRNPMLIEIPQEKIQINNVPINGPYTNLIEFDGGTWVGNPMALYFEFDLKTSSDIVEFFIITSLFDTNGVETYRVSYDLGIISEHWTTQKTWRVKQFLPPFPENAGRFVSYFYNPKDEEHLIKHLTLSLSTIEEPLQTVKNN